MEWTDGLEYQLMNVDKTFHCSRGEVVSAVSPLLASTGSLRTSSLCFLASYPGQHVECSVHGEGYVLVYYPWLWQRECQVTCVLIGTSLKLAMPNYGLAFGRS